MTREVTSDEWSRMDPDERAHRRRAAHMQQRANETVHDVAREESLHRSCGPRRREGPRHCISAGNCACIGAVPGPAPHLRRDCERCIMSKNPHFYAEREPERVVPIEAPAADPEYFRVVGDAFGCTAVYLDDRHTLLEMLRPEFWRRCVTQGLWRGTVIELRMGEPAELKTRRVCVVDVNRHTGDVTLSIEGGMDGKDGRGSFKIVSFPDVPAKVKPKAA